MGEFCFTLLPSTPAQVLLFYFIFLLFLFLFPVALPVFVFLIMFIYVLLVIVLMFLVKGFVFFTVSRCICAVNEQCVLFFCYLNAEIQRKYDRSGRMHHLVDFLHNSRAFAEFTDQVLI